MSQHGLAPGERSLITEGVTSMDIPGRERHIAFIFNVDVLWSTRLLHNAKVEANVQCLFDRPRAGYSLVSTNPS